jgi:hypothetical protein
MAGVMAGCKRSKRVRRLETVTSQIKEGYILIGSTIGLIVAGLAPATLYGYSLWHALDAEGWKPVGAIAAGVGLALTVEFAGAVAAYVAQHDRNSTRRIIAYSIMAIYTFVGLGYMLLVEKNAVVQRTGVMAYLVAPLLYTAVSLLSSMLEQGKERETGRSIASDLRRDDLAWQRQQRELQAQREHEAKLRKMELDTQARMERDRAKIATTNRSESGQKAVTFSSDWRLLPESDKARMIDLTSGEIAAKYGVSDSTARRWLRNARELTAQVSANGHVKEGQP